MKVFVTIMTALVLVVLCGCESVPIKRDAGHFAPETFYKIDEVSVKKDHYEKEMWIDASKIEFVDAGVSGFMLLRAYRDYADGKDIIYYQLYVSTTSYKRMLFHSAFNKVGAARYKLDLRIIDRWVYGLGRCDCLVCNNRIREDFVINTSRMRLEEAYKNNGFLLSIEGRRCEIELIVERDYIKNFLDRTEIPLEETWQEVRGKSKTIREEMKRRREEAAGNK